MLELPKICFEMVFSILYHTFKFSCIKVQTRLFCYKNLYSTTSQTQTDKCFAFISFLLPEDITILTVTKYVSFQAEVKSKAYLGPSHTLILLEK